MSTDFKLQVVKKLVKEGWPKHVGSVPVQAKAYHQWANSLSISKLLLLYGDCIVIPHSIRSDTLHRLHDGHQGITKCRERWPGLEKEIKEVVKMCPECMETRPTICKEKLSGCH